LKEEDLVFTGFNSGLFQFLKDLKKNNKVEWFHNNKERYQKNLVIPAKAFITELAPFLNRLNPAIRTEPKFNETIMRLNKDMRFAKGEPYRPFLLIHFGRFKLDSEFYLYFEPDGAELGMFINNSKEKNLFFKQNSIKYQKEIINTCKNYGIDNNYSLSDLNDDMNIVEKKFNSEKHFNKLSDIEYILIQTKKKIPEKILFSTKIVEEMIKMILQLYPLYCFAISPQPLKLLQKFKDDFGEAV
jgi:uncharacterized protein (TIGR02453 family)